jgi:hypothetical protein
MAKTNEDFELELDHLGVGPRQALIVAAHKDDVIWDDATIAHGLDGESASELREYILRTYDPVGAKLG